MYFVGIDAGTSGTTTIIVDADGNVVGKGSSTYSTDVTRFGFTEQNPEVLWEGVLSSCRAAISNTAIDPKAITSISLASQRGTFLVVDKEFTPLTPAILWSDQRAVEQHHWFISHVGEDTFKHITGCSIAPMWTGMKIKWLVDNFLMGKASYILNEQEWLLHKLGATELCTDVSSVTMNGMLAIKERDWSDTILSAIGITRALLPPIKPSGTLVGHLTKIVAERIGFPAGVPLYLGGGDQQCAAIGTGAYHEDSLALILGTGAVAVGNTKEIDTLLANPSKASYVIGGHVIPDRWDVEGISLSAGNSYRWWKDVAWKSSDQSSGSNVFALMDDAGKAVPIGSHGLLFLPYLSKQIVPKVSLDATGVLYGLTQAHDRAHMTRAVMEGVTFELCTLVKTLEEILGKKFPSIRVTGGGFVSPLWSSMFSSMLGAVLEVPHCTESTALGAAMLGAVGSGVFASVRQASSHMVRIERQVLPDTKDAQAYQDLYCSYKEKENQLFRP
ncbi:MAG: FGGY family carbohydrate kinase [Sphaerochaeta sp.]|nr:FGGY family carbohydrate kinase [Sphaerochaeta sp.]